MTVSYPLRVFLDCATAHLSIKTRSYLERRALARDAMIAETPYGWFVWCPEHADDDHPADLTAVLAYARVKGAEYVLFDRDAEESDALPKFDEPT